MISGDTSDNEPSSSIALLYESIAAHKSNISLTQAEVEEICDHIESIPVDNYNKFRRVIGDRVTTERLIRWLDLSAELKLEAFYRLGERCPERIREQALRALDDHCENVANAACRVLGTSKNIEWYFESMPALVPAQQSAVARSMVFNHVDFSDYRPQLFDAILQSESEEVATALIWNLAGLSEIVKSDVEFVTQVSTQFNSSSWKVQLVELLQSLSGRLPEESLVEGLAKFFTDPDPFVRAIAIKAMGRHSMFPRQAIRLVGPMWNDEFEQVQRAVLWSLIYYGSEARRYLIQKLPETCSDRLVAELAIAFDGELDLRDMLISRLQGKSLGPLASSVLRAE